MQRLPQLGIPLYDADFQITLKFLGSTGTKDNFDLTVKTSQQVPSFLLDRLMPASVKRGHGIKVPDCRVPPSPGLEPRLLFIIFCVQNREIYRAAGIFPHALVFTVRSFRNRHTPAGIRISNRAPRPGSLVSAMVKPVIDRISRDKKRPKPVCFPKPLVKSRGLSSSAIPAPSVLADNPEPHPFKHRP